jgi:hypothetical protein
MSKTFWELLDALKSADDVMMDEELDLKDMLFLTAEKVDAIRYVDERLEAQEMLLKRREEEIRGMRQAVSLNRERLRKRTLEAMVQHGFEKLPGKEWRIQRMKAPPSLAFHEDRPATDMDYLTYPDFVKKTYEWNKEAIKTELARGPSPFPLAYLKPGEYVRFYPIK